MANPQIEDGHTDIANEIMEALAKTRIPGEARQVLDFILRKTYGWHKKEDRIPLSQISHKTGLNRPAVVRAIRRLIDMNLVIKKDTSTSNIYRFNKNYHTWHRGIKKDTGVSKKITGGIKKDNGGVSKKIHSNETPSKETFQKKLSSDTHTFLKIFGNLWSQGVGGGEIYPCNFGKEGKLVKDLLRMYPLSRLRELAEIFFVREDDWLKNTGYTIGVFKTQIPKLIAKKEGKLDEIGRRTEEQRKEIQKIMSE